MLLTETNISEFKKKGYTILENGLTENEVSLLHEEADILSNFIMSEGYDLVKDFGCVIEPLGCGFLDDPETSDYKVDATKYSNIRNSINWNNPVVSKSTQGGTTVAEIIINKYGRTWASQLLESKDIYLLNEQFIIKPPMTSKLSQFEWHKDSDYYFDQRHKDEQTIACWTALDNVKEHNGTVELIDYSGQSKIINMLSGSILFMANNLLHRSTGNASRTFRRAYMPQFSINPIIHYDKKDLPFHQQCVGYAVCLAEKEIS